MLCVQLQLLYAMLPMYVYSTTRLLVIGVHHQEQHLTFSTGRTIKITVLELQCIYIHGCIIYIHITVIMQGSYIFGNCKYDVACIREVVSHMHIAQPHGVHGSLHCLENVRNDGSCCFNSSCSEYIGNIGNQIAT